MFAGLLTYRDAAAPASWVSAETWHETLYPHHKPDIFGQNSRQQSLLVEADIHNTPSSKYRQAAPLVLDDYSLSFWGRLDNRQTLADLLSITKPLEQTPDAELVLAGWKLWGENLPKKLLGDFAFAIIDNHKKSLFLARDPIGIKPLYYWPHKDGFVFASTPAALLKLKNTQPTISKEWIALYIIGQSSSHTNTGYEEIKKLPGGYWLSAREGSFKLTQYHQWRDDAPVASKREPDNLIKYRASLEHTIRDQMVSDAPLGTENSGGIDSATITVYLSKLANDTNKKIHGLAFACLEHEARYIADVSEAAGLKHNHCVTERDINAQDLTKSIWQSLQILGYPQEHYNAMMHKPFYEICQTHGIKTLFSGYGGDEVVTNYANNLFYEIIAQRQFHLLYEMEPGKPVAKLLRIIKRLWQSKAPPSRHDGIFKMLMNTWHYHPLHDSIAKQYALKDRLHEAGQYDAPYRRHNDWIINGMLKLGYVPTRLENCTLLAASYGIDYRWPLWDQRLVQQYLSTPIVERKGPNGIGRYLHRRAITGTVPDSVTWKRSKDMGARVEPKDRRLSLIVKNMKHADANLHPLLEEFINRDKWRALITTLKSGHCDLQFENMTGAYADAVQWLNIWLHNKPIG